MASSTTSPATGAIWRPGGPRAKPSTAETASGDSTYYRLMADGSIKEVLGHRYAYASNYAHPYDTEVTVEDLSHIDIDAGIRSKFEAILPLLLHEPVSLLVNTFTEFEENVELGYIIEVFDFCGLAVERRTYTEIDVYSTKRDQYSRGPIALRVEKDRKQHFNGDKPPMDVVQYLMAVILVEIIAKYGKYKGRKSEKWREIVTNAHGRLYRAADLAVEVARCREIISGPDTMPAGVQEQLVEVRKNEKKFDKALNKHHQLQIDRASAEVCDRITGKDIVILRDKNHKLIAGAFCKATQKVLPKWTLERMDRALKSLGWRHSISAADASRHGTAYDDHLVQNPEKAIESAIEPHNVASGTDHYGNNHPAGHSGVKDLQCQEFAHGRSPTPGLKNSPAFTVELPKVKDGVWGVSEKEVRLTLKAWDPELYNRLVRIRQLIPPSIRVTFATTGDNPHSFLAQLFDVQTEGHVDDSDMKFGLAAIKCFGDFTGGDLVFKGLGVRIEYPSGSHCHLRGSELYHYVMPYKGIRHCLVLITKESVVKAAKVIEERMEELRKTVNELQAKEPESLTKEDLELIAASENDDSLSEYVSQEAKAAPKGQDSAKVVARTAKKEAEAAKKEVIGKKVAKRDHSSESDEPKPKKAGKRAKARKA